MTLQTFSVSGRPPITCASYGVMIVDKITRATVARLPEVGWTLEYDYRIDRTSEATLTVNVGPGGVGEECCSRLGRVGHWMHELVVYREGNNREVWGGPVVKLRDSPGRGQFVVQAKDRSAWWWRRALPYDLIYSGSTRADATRVFMDLLKAAEQATGSSAWKLPYDPVRLNVSGRETGVIVDGKVLTASDLVMIGPEIQTLSDSVIDWTVIGRTCHVGSLVIEMNPLPILAQDHWLEMDPEIEWDGETVATQVVVKGARGITGIWPPGPIEFPRWPQYGSHTERVSDPKITDQATATERARTLWEQVQQPTLCVLSAGGSLGANAPVTPEDLVPGRLANVGFDTSCFVTGTRLAQTRENGVLQYVAYDSLVPRDLVVAQRITKTTVTVEDSQEVAVLVDLQPPGTADIRRLGGRSNRQPVHETPEPVVADWCADLFWNDGADIGTVGEFSTYDSNGHPGACSEDYNHLIGNGSGKSWDFGLTADQATAFNLGYLLIVGQQFNNGADATFDLEINGFTYALDADDAPGEGLPAFPTAGFEEVPWQARRYNTADIVGDQPFVAGANHVELRVNAANSTVIGISRIEFERLIIGAFVSEGGCVREPDPPEVVASHIETFGAPTGGPETVTFDDSAIEFDDILYCFAVGDPTDDALAFWLPTAASQSDGWEIVSGRGDVNMTYAYCRYTGSQSSIELECLDALIGGNPGPATKLQVGIIAVRNARLTRDPYHYQTFVATVPQAGITYVDATVPGGVTFANTLDFSGVTIPPYVWIADGGLIVGMMSLFDPDLTVSSPAWEVDFQGEDGEVIRDNGGDQADMTMTLWAMRPLPADPTASTWYADGPSGSDSAQTSFEHADVSGNGWWASAYFYVPPKGPCYVCPGGCTVIFES